MRVVALMLVGAVALEACTGAGGTTTSVPRVSGSPTVGVASPSRGRLLPRHQTVVAEPTTRYVGMRRNLVDPTSGLVFDTRNPNMRLSPLLVTDAARDVSGEPWYRVLLPIEPNGSAAWVRGTDVRLVPRDQKIVVDLSQRTLRYFVGGDLAALVSVGVGTPSAPTATGIFYVWIRVRYSSPTGPYGAFALGLSGFSEVLSEWPGGGRMAIHGTSDPSDRGRAVSHGCIRVYNPELKVLRRVPLGTPVIIHR
jgi:lipoprotein-anchoring transpeptidase ErfK/SrfK